MKKSEIRQLIKEEILNLLKEGYDIKEVRKKLDDAFKKAGVKVQNVKEYKQSALDIQNNICNFDYDLGGVKPGVSYDPVHIVVHGDSVRWEDVGKIVKLGKLGTSQFVSALKKNFKD